MDVRKDGCHQKSLLAGRPIVLTLQQNSLAPGRREGGRHWGGEFQPAINPLRTGPYTAIRCCEEGLAARNFSLCSRTHISEGFLNSFLLASLASSGKGEGGRKESERGQKGASICPAGGREERKEEASPPMLKADTLRR